MVRFTLDSTVLTDTPRGWDEATITSKRSSRVNGIFTEYTSDIEFWGDGFAYIDNIINTDGYCSTIEVLIESDDCEEGEFVVDFKGVIPITQINEYNVDNRTIKAEIVDKGYSAMIDNNRKAKAVLTTDDDPYAPKALSKNGVEIDAITPLSINFYDPQENFNNYSFTDRSCYRLFDVFEYLIAYMTDGEIGFQSTLLDAGGQFENLVILNGVQLRTGNGEEPDTSFQIAFEELNKKVHIGFATVPDGVGGFNLKLEIASDFEKDEAIFTVNNVQGIKMNFNLEEMYSSILVGSNQYELATSLSFPPVRLRGWREENYTVQGQCNLDNELNIVSRWIVDSNTIEDVLLNGEDKHDDKIFMVNTGGVNAFKNDIFNIVLIAGQNTSTAANKLIDAGANFGGAGVVVGTKVDNQTTGQSAQVTALDSPTTISLSADIFTGFPETYQVIDFPFTYNNSLSNYKSIERWLSGIPSAVVKYFGTGDDNFQASRTVNVNIAAFPNTSDPIPYNDDSTPPNFDDNNNYSIGTFEYTLPADGLYGFKTINSFKVAGDVGVNTIVNGDFLSGVGWIGATGGGATSISNIDWTVNTGLARASIMTGRSTPDQVMYQGHTFLANNKYQLTFEVLDYEEGTIQVATSISGGGRIIHGSFNSNGTHQVNISMTSQQQHNRLEFIAVKGLIEADFSITNVTLGQVPIFTITNNITRYNSNSEQLEQFQVVEAVPLDFDLQEKEITLENDTNAFGAFQDDIISASYTIAVAGGAGISATFLAGSTFRSTIVEDGGGVIADKDANDFAAYFYEFEKPMSLSQFNEIKDNPERAIVFNEGTDADKNITAWRNEISFDKEQGVATFTVRSKQKIQTDC